MSQTAAAQPAVLLHRPQHSEAVTAVEELMFRPPRSQCGFEVHCFCCSVTDEAQGQQQSGSRAATLKGRRHRCAAAPMRIAACAARREPGAS